MHFTPTQHFALTLPLNLLNNPKNNPKLEYSPSHCNSVLVLQRDGGKEKRKTKEKKTQKEKANPAARRNIFLTTLLAF